MNLTRIIFNFILIILVFIGEPLTAQQNNIWCFGDSAGLDFNSGTPIPISSSLDTRGTSVSISNENGELLFYANTRSGTSGNTTGLIWNRNHQLMLNGDSIAGDGWYHEMVIVPHPGDDSLYYIFSIGVTIPFGLKYCVIDMRADNTLGEVVQKNIPLDTNNRLVDCLTAIKHGNGRDWWLFTRPSPIQQPTYNNSWKTYLITPSGISLDTIQNLGMLNGTNIGSIRFSPQGSKLCFTNSGGMIELYDFDRCTGFISNPITIEPQLTMGPYPFYWSSEFSLNGQYLYVTSQTNPISRLWQFDTWAPNITVTKTLIWQTSFPPYTAGALKRGPDNKIYLSCGWVDSLGIYYYPYPSFAYYPENMNLSVINSPEISGVGCDFQPWSVYLGGKRTYWGLPNNPDYELPNLVGSPCDTLVGIHETFNATSPAEFFVYYASEWHTAFISANKLKGTSYHLEVFDLLGRSVFLESHILSLPYFTKNLSCTGFAKGMYVVNLVTDKEKLVKRFIVN